MTNIANTSQDCTRKLDAVFKHQILLCAVVHILRTKHKIAITTKTQALKKRTKQPQIRVVNLNLFGKFDWSCSKYSRKTTSV